MRHATQDDLDQLEVLLADLRALPELRERKRGYFSLRSRAFLHFHEDAGDFYADVKLTGSFERLRVSSRSEQLAFLSQVCGALRPAARTGRTTDWALSRYSSADEGTPR